MFTCINIGTPRKKIKNMIDQTLLANKFKKDSFIKHNKLAFFLFLAAVLNSSNVEAASFSDSKNLSFYYNNFMVFLEEIGYPTIDAVFQLAKMTKPTIDYINVKYLK